MKAFLKLFSIEFKLALREFSGMLFGVMLPFGIILLLGFIYGDKMIDGVKYMDLAVPAVITIGIAATGLMGIPLTISSYREKGVLKRFMVTPTTPILLLTVQFFNNLVTAVVSSLAVIIVAVLAFNYRVSGQIITLILGYITVVFCIYSIGLLIGSISNSIKTANLLTSLLYFPMFFLSGGTIPYEIMPRVLQKVSNILPMTHGIKLLKGLSLGEKMYEHTASFMILLSIGVVCILISIKTFKYDYE